MAIHALKVVAPYFDALADGSKTFEVRRNDRGFQKGDTLVLQEWHDDVDIVAVTLSQRCDQPDCNGPAGVGHFSQRLVFRTVTFVYSGDPRFRDVEPGVVVLALAVADP